MGVKILNEEIRIDIVVLLIFIGGCLVYFFACSCNEKLAMNYATTLPPNGRLTNSVKRQDSASCGKKLSRSEYGPEPVPFGTAEHSGSVY
jgi:hypothetical protein